MSTIVSKRRAIQRAINWPAYKEQRAHLADIFAVIAYSGQAKRPLALGIRHDLVGANTGLSPDEVKHFLRAYTFGPKYLRALKAGAVRVDLGELAAGTVTAEEAEYAALSLRAHYADRERRRTVREIGARAVEAAVRADALTDNEPQHGWWPGAPAEPPYTYRFGRLSGTNAFNPQREYPGSYGTSSAEAA